MRPVVVAGIGTEIGKTVISAILVEALGADYWKPVQSGNLDHSDTDCIRQWVDRPDLRCHPEAYRLKSPLSPHHAAALDGVHCSTEAMVLPETDRPLVIEMAGGLLVPISDRELLVDALVPWNCHWVIVCKHYLGSINHSLLTIEAMRQRGLEITGIVFNGPALKESEDAILSHGKIPVLGHVHQEETIHTESIRRYAALWKTHPALSSILTSAKPLKTTANTSGTPLPRPKRPQPPSPSSRRKEPSSTPKTALSTSTPSPRGG